MTTLLHSARLLDHRGEVPAAWLLLDGARIAAVGSGLDSAPDADERVDLGSATVVPGFVDLHGHGGGGHAYDDGGAELAAALAVHRRHGTTRSVVSLVAAPVDQLATRLGAIADLAQRDPLVLGSHLEGPFLAPSRHGAHDPAHLRHPDPDAVDTLLGAARGTLRQVTIAPELPWALQAIPRFVAAGVVVAIGHTEADADTTRAAIDRGARLVTHAFNAMPGIHHRQPGPLAAALTDPRVTLELILDGEHVHPDVARVALAAAPDRIALVTDAMAAAGAEDGDYRLGALSVEVRDGVARVAGTDTLAGSTLTQDAALRHALRTAGLDPAAAVAALSTVPARVLGLDDRLGTLAPGFAADVVALNDDFHPTAVWADGIRLH